MDKPKIDEAKVLSWATLELRVKIGDIAVSWTGWKAALMHTFIVLRAAMTMSGAHELVNPNGEDIDIKQVWLFIKEQYTDGLLKYHYEIRKTGKRMRIYKSGLNPNQFEYERVIHKEET